MEGWPCPLEHGMRSKLCSAVQRNAHPCGLLEACQLVIFAYNTESEGKFLFYYNSSRVFKKNKMLDEVKKYVVFSHENVGSDKKYFPSLKIILHTFLSSSFTLGCLGFTLWHLHSFKCVQTSHPQPPTVAVTQPL